MEGVIIFRLWVVCLRVCGVGVGFWGGFAKKGYTPLFRRQKGAHLENVWAIYKKLSMFLTVLLFGGKKQRNTLLCPFSSMSTLSWP